MDESGVAPESVQADAPQYLRRFDLLLGRFFEVSLDMLCVASLDGYFRTVNPAWADALGYSEEELLSRPYLEFVHPEDRDITGAESANLSTGASVLSFDNRYIARDGSYHWLAWNAMPQLDEGLIYAIARDVTVQKHRQQVADAQNAIIRALSRSQDWDRAVDVTLRTVLEEMGWSRGELWVPDGHRLRLSRLVQNAEVPADALNVVDLKVDADSVLCGRAWSGAGAQMVADLAVDIEFARSEPLRPGALRGAVAFPVMKQDQAMAVIAFFSPDAHPLSPANLESLANLGIQLGDHRLRLDAEEASRMSDQLTRASLEFRASHDSLTGLANRELALDRLERSISTARRLDRRLAVMMLDIDHFKEINDGHGHAAGDDILCETAARLTAALREADTVARLGGDEFAVIAFLGESADSAETLGQRVSQAFAGAFGSVPGLEVAASAGLAEFPVDGTTPAALLAAADSAMYAAKIRGDGFARFESAMPPGRAGSR